jgi:hypothetical protein
MPDDDTTRQTEDDALEEDTRPDDIYNPDLDEETLPDDFDTPAAPTTTKYDDSLRTHPITDDSVDRDELYNEGIGEATSYSETLEDSDDAHAERVDLEPEDE